MEYNLSDLKKKSVVNVLDGKIMGKITDVIISYPEGTWTALIVEDRLKCIFSSEKFYVKLCCIEKVGEDSILVRLSGTVEDAETVG